MAPIRGIALLDRTIDRVWAANQHACSQEQHELGAIVLQLLAGLKDACRGITVGDEIVRVTPLNLASYRAHGVPFEKWCRLNEERKARLAGGLEHCIPDYDPADDPRRNKVVRTGRL